ncbi:MAG: phosphatidylserine decarboxylase [Treponema sp.]|jgi:phosphatidylserine decarboxylase|nr:phosphatidylserine decarboxylase [Treponema sp.]
MDIFTFLGHYIQFYPLAALAGLLLAGFNIPVSEDLVIITGALVSRREAGLLVPSLLAIYAGVIISDFTAYYLGVLVRKGAVRLKFAAAPLSPQNLERVRRRLEKRGALTFILCRFIPLGVRNILFMASGFLGLPPRRFALYDITAALISTNTLFFLTYRFGAGVRDPFRAAGMVLFVLLGLALLVLLIRFLARAFPLTPYGLPQVALFPALCAAAMAVLLAVPLPGGPARLWIIPLEAVLFLILIWSLSFFRNPPRNIPKDESVLLSPADGRVTDISQVEDEELGRLLRIGIFLSVFNVHLNRAPCSARVERITYRKGRFKDARSPESTRVNESNAILMTRLAEPRDRLLVRQISGAIARRIVCGAKEKDELTQGELFGMIKFGSRTELYIPAGPGGGSYEVAVKTGDSVRAGLSPLVRYTGKA